MIYTSSEALLNINFVSEADPGGDPREQRNPPFAQNIKIDF